MQLTLSINLRDDATFTNFFCGNNQQLIDYLKVLTTGDAPEKFVYLWGKKGAGSTHLLQACCHDSSDHRKTAIYLPIEDESLNPDVLLDLEQVEVVCLDNIQTVMADPAWEEALMHFYNRMRENGHALVIAGDAPPKQLDCQLQDLKSRLSWGVTFQVNGLSDEEKLEALQRRALNRGLELSHEVGQFLLRHMSRDMGVLFDMLDRLDKASLVAKRRLTIPFIKDTLNF